MNEHANRPRRLRWWFWLLLFAPALINIVVIPLPGILTMNPGDARWHTNWVLLALLALNFICPAWAAVALQRHRSGRLSRWTAWMGISFFFLNPGVTFGGCTALIFLRACLKKGGTGYQPVPLGNLPSGMREEHHCSTHTGLAMTPSLCRRAGSPAAQAGSLCYPVQIFRQALSE